MLLRGGRTTKLACMCINSIVSADCVQSWYATNTRAQPVREHMIARGINGWLLETHEVNIAAEYGWIPTPWSPLDIAGSIDMDEAERSKSGV